MATRSMPGALDAGSRKDVTSGDVRVHSFPLSLVITLLDLDLIARTFGSLTAQLPQRISRSHVEIHIVNKVEEHDKLLLAERRR